MRYGRAKQHAEQPHSETEKKRRYAEIDRGFDKALESDRTEQSGGVDEHQIRLSYAVQIKIQRHQMHRRFGNLQPSAEGNPNESGHQTVECNRRKAVEPCRREADIRINFGAPLLIPADEQISDAGGNGAHHLREDRLHRLQNQQIV